MIDHSNHKNEIIRNAWQRGLDVLKPSNAQLEHGLELHSSLFTCDNFAFLPQPLSQEFVQSWNELKEGNVGARELALFRLFNGPLAATRDPAAAEEFLSAIRATGLKCIVQTVAEGKSREEDIGRMSTSRHVCRVFRKCIVQAGASEEIREANETGRTAVVWSANGPPLVGKLVDPDEEFRWVQTWYNLGIRLMHLTYNRRNFVGDGCTEPSNAGLSALGRDLVRKMNEVGIIVDTAHSGPQTTLDAAKVSERPILASHTGAKALFGHIRCKSDDAIKAIAEKDGLVGVYAIPTMLGPNATLNALLDHVDYIARLVGADHVGIGTDITYQQPKSEGALGYQKSRFSQQWWGNWDAVKDPLPPSDEAATGSLAWTNWPLFTVGLVMRGYSDDDIAKILGRNFLRVLDATRPVKEIVL